MPTLRDIHEFAVEEAMDEDPRTAEEIQRELDERKEAYEDLDGVRREAFDTERLDNPFDDSKVLYGEDREVEVVAVGIDVQTPELLLLDRLNEQGRGIDGAIGHHPQGKAYANLSEVMKLQIDAMNNAGIPVSQAEWVIRKSATEVDKRLHARNHPRTPQAAAALDIPLACMHTTADNHAWSFTTDYLAEAEPYTLDDILDALLELPEFQWALGHSTGPKIFAGDGSHRAGTIGVLGYTGGTDPEEDMIGMMVDAGIDTLVAMHASKDQIQEAEEQHLNVISTGHMAADSLGMNLLLDKVQDAFGIDVVPLSGFHRVER